jgi:hypothetical protein
LTFDSEPRREAKAFEPTKANGVSHNADVLENYHRLSKRVCEEEYDICTCPDGSEGYCMDGWCQNCAEVPEPTTTTPTVTMDGILPTAASDMDQNEAPDMDQNEAPDMDQNEAPDMGNGGSDQG